MQHLRPLGRLPNLASNEWVASTDQVLICANAGRVRPIDVNRHRRHGRPGIGHDVVAIMNGRSICAIPSTRHVNVLAYNTVSGATQRDGNICARGIPRIRIRIVLPSRVSFSKARIKPSDNVDFVGTTIIRRARKIARTRHGSAIGDPGAASDVVDLDGAAWRERAIKAAEYINAVGGRVVSRRGVIEGTWHVW